jgi:photosystem II stability/assembly factor-like uncharacterized protein
MFFNRNGQFFVHENSSKYWMDILKICVRVPRLCAGLVLFLLLAGVQTSTAAAQQAWRAIGPDGGDARSLASVPGHPDHLYLGTDNSTIYESNDGGGMWSRLARLDPADDMVIAHIVLDAENPSHILVAAWRFDKPEGGLYVSEDGGQHWSQAAALHNHPVFSLVQSPSNTKVLIAGTLDGVYRSEDSGATWTQISPAGSGEIHEIESLAIDPENPDVIYAGTWHLPWKTTDGGQHWFSIKDGLIVDSDVFSILIDPQHPHIVYASACSGIYKSESAGKLFHKIEGIPSTARRTRVLRQDPAHPETVYAGTTEGLYKTTDGGHTFRRMTGEDVIVNDVWVDPDNTNRVLMATDRGGVLASDNGGESFTASNHGFSARRVQALLVDSQDTNRIYAGVVNDKTYGGAFVSNDGGVEWKQIAQGLDGRDVFALSETQDGTVVAGTNSGIFTLSKDADTWTAKNSIVNTVMKPDTKVVRRKRVTVEKAEQQTLQLGSRVYALDASSDVWVAATADGLFTSHDQGASWQGGPAVDAIEFHALAVHGSTIAASRLDGVVISNDSGKTWTPLRLPDKVSQVYRIAFDEDGTLWIGAREGLYFLHKNSTTWMWLARLPLVNVSGLSYDSRQNRLFATSRGADFIYVVNPRTLTWTWERTGYPLYLVRPAGDRIFAASLADGVLASHASSHSQAQVSENVTDKSGQK